MYAKNRLKLDKIASDNILNARGFDECYTLAKNLSDNGKVYVIGGIIYRGLVNSVYGKESRVKDIDFMTNNPLKLNGEYFGFSMTFNSFNNPKFTKGDLTCDIIAIKDVEHIKSNNLDSTLENFLAGCPLNVQALAFDVDERKLIGETGIKSIFDRRVKVNNKKSLDKYCKMKGFERIGYIVNTGKSIGFDLEI